MIIELEISKDFARQRSSFALQAIIRSGLFLGFKELDQMPGCLCQTRANLPKLPAVLLKVLLAHSQSEVLNSSQHFRKDTMYLLMNKAEKTNFLEPLLSLRDKITEVRFGPFKPHDQSVVVLQGEQGTRVFFDSCTECLWFVDQLRAPVQDAPIAVENLEEQNDRFGMVREESDVDGMLQYSKEMYFHLEDNQQNDISQQVQRWKDGLKWYNVTLAQLQKSKTSKPLISYFQASIARELSSFFVGTWNKIYDKLNIEECAYFEGIVSNILKNTEVFKGSDSSKINALQSATMISLECMSSNNLAAIVKKILTNFWGKDNFDVLQGKFISYSANDIISLIIDLQRKFDVMDDESSKKVLRNICIE